METLAELLDRNNYRVVVQHTDHGCLMTVPRRVELPAASFDRLYQEFQADGILVCQHDETGAEMEEPKIFKCPPYAQRLFVMYNILSYCMAVGYSGSAIKFMDGPDEVDEEEFHKAVVSPFMEEYEQGKEDKLRQIVMLSFANGFTPQFEAMAKQESVVEGYIPIRSLFIQEQ